MRSAPGLYIFSLCTIMLSLHASASTALIDLTGNNTSASSEFIMLSNGNAAPGNVSKLPVRKLIPGNFTGKILAHWMPWWKCSTTPCDGVHDRRGPVRVRYAADDAVQIDNTIKDMISRGYDGVVVAEANSGGTDTAGALAMAAEMHKFPTFLFCVSENHLNKSGDEGAQLQRLVTDIAFANSHFFSLPNYLRMNGKPVVYVFDPGKIHWSTASGQTAGNPLYFLNGPSHAAADLGGFYWFGKFPDEMTQTGSAAITSLSSFYSTVAANPNRLYSGTFFKGFDDTLAPWTKHRRIDQDCGMTFIRSLGAVSTDLPLIQVATWNDYEEGTEVETGVDNCAAIGIRVSGTVVTPIPTFTGVGTEETVDHYEAYLSQDGRALTDAGSIPVGGGSLDLSSRGPAAGTYKVYVQMVGKSHILNHISAPGQVTFGRAPASANSPAGKS